MILATKYYCKTQVIILCAGLRIISCFSRLQCLTLSGAERYNSSYPHPAQALLCNDAMIKRLTRLKELKRLVCYSQLCVLNIQSINAQNRTSVHNHLYNILDIVGCTGSLWQLWACICYEGFTLGKTQAYSWSTKDSRPCRHSIMCLSSLHLHFSYRDQINNIYSIILCYGWPGLVQPFQS